MSTLKPEQSGRYHISSVTGSAVVSNGRTIFKGYGYDATQDTDNVFYMMLVSLERTVALKAFLESFKVNLVKDIEKKDDADKDATLVTQHSGKISYDVILNLPAHSVNEAANNVAKIEELQKLIQPVSEHRAGGKYSHLTLGAATHMPIFKVLFKNLISNGNNIQVPNLNHSRISTQNIHNLGLPCYVTSIRYEPDQAAGYFEHDHYLFPKNLKLSLKLNLDQTTLEYDNIMNFAAASVIKPFTEDGQYDSDDIGGFPFGIKVVTDEAKADPFGSNAEDNNASLNAHFSNKTLNDIEFGATTKDPKGKVKSKISERDIGYIYFSNGASEVTAPTKFIKRYVLFKPFIESFSRDVRVNVKENESKDLDISGGLVPGSLHTFGELKYEMKFTLPAASVEEAKKNCGKLSYLSRMFFKQVNDRTIMSSTKKPQRRVSVYVPSMIESPSATFTRPNVKNHKNMQKNALELFFESLSFDVNLEMGFFEEGGMLYPKEMSVTVGLFLADGSILNNYQYDFVNRGYKHRDRSYQYPGKSEFFPFNRKTIKLGGK